MECQPYDFKPYSRSFARFLLPFVWLLLISPCAWPQQVPKKVDIQVHADKSQGELSPIWNYFGYDEPNYTYAVNGKKLLERTGCSRFEAGLCSRPQSVDHGRRRRIFEVGIDQRLHRRRSGQAGL